MSNRIDDFGKMEPGKLYLGLHETDGDMAEVWTKWTSASRPGLATVFHIDCLPPVPNDDIDGVLFDELREYMRGGGLVPLTWDLTGWAFATLDSMTIDEFFKQGKETT